MKEIFFKSNKNFIPLVKKIAPILKKYEELHVVCTGHPFNEEENKLFEDLGFSDRFVCQWIADDATMYNLYHHAVCFVYPSEYEGFGIPIIEAINCGVPVIAATGSCLEEAGGPDCQYVNPDDESALAQAIEHIIDKPENQNQRRDSIAKSK